MIVRAETQKLCHREEMISRPILSGLFMSCHQVEKAVPTLLKVSGFPVQAKMPAVVPDPTASPGDIGFRLTVRTA
jgi:hypothetical protein